MGNRSRIAAIAGTAVGVAGVRAVRRARRRARLRGAAEGIADALMPSIAEDTPSAVPVPVGDEAHAPGHRHLPSTAGLRDQPAPDTIGSRPFAKHRHGLRHPGKW